MFVLPPFLSNLFFQKNIIIFECCPTVVVDRQPKGKSPRVLFVQTYHSLTASNDPHTDTWQEMIRKDCFFPSR